MKKYILFIITMLFAFNIQASDFDTQTIITEDIIYPPRILVEEYYDTILQDTIQVWKETIIDYELTYYILDTTVYNPTIQELENFVLKFHNRYYQNDPYQQNTHYIKYSHLTSENVNFSIVEKKELYIQDGKRKQKSEKYIEVGE